MGMGLCPRKMLCYILYLSGSLQNETLFLGNFVLCLSALLSFRSYILLEQPFNLQHISSFSLINKEDVLLPMSYIRGRCIFSHPWEDRRDYSILNVSITAGISLQISIILHPTSPKHISDGTLERVSFYSGLTGVGLTCLIL